MTFRRKNEVREERRVEPDEGRSFEEVVRVWMLSVRLRGSEAGLEG
jgi:uncharacterized protein (DUF2384 family)